MLWLREGHPYSLPLSLLQLGVASLLGLQVQLEVVHLGSHLGCLLPHLVQVALEIILLALRVHQLKGGGGVCRGWVGKAISVGRGQNINEWGVDVEGGCGVDEVLQ